MPSEHWPDGSSDRFLRSILATPLSSTIGPFTPCSHDLPRETTPAKSARE